MYCDDLCIVVNWCGSVIIDVSLVLLYVVVCSILFLSMCDRVLRVQFKISRSCGFELSKLWCIYIEACYLSSCVEDLFT